MLDNITGVVSSNQHRLPNFPRPPIWFRNPVHTRLGGLPLSSSPFNLMAYALLTTQSSRQENPRAVPSFYCAPLGFGYDQHESIGPSSHSSPLFNPVAMPSMGQCADQPATPSVPFHSPGLFRCRQPTLVGFPGYIYFPRPSFSSLHSLSSPIYFRPLFTSVLAFTARSLVASVTWVLKFTCVLCIMLSSSVSAS